MQNLSSIFVEERPADMTEYAMAKAAGELLCSDLARASRAPHIVSRRLPRLLTDETAAVTPADTSDSLQVLLPIIRAVQQERRPV